MEVVAVVSVSTFILGETETVTSIVSVGYVSSVVPRIQDEERR